jgi:hypothetical protein
VGRQLDPKEEKRTYQGRVGGDQGPREVRSQERTTPPIQRHRSNERESGLTPGSLFREIGPSGSHDCSGNWDHFNLIFPVYSKLMAGFPSFQSEDVGPEQSDSRG